MYDGRAPCLEDIEEQGAKGSLRSTSEECGVDHETAPAMLTEPFLLKSSSIPDQAQIPRHWCECSNYNTPVRR